jgi:type II secretory pathway pseudopilin PulG
LIELLVVIAIIGILISLLLPAVQKVREAANCSKCQNNLKQIGLAFHKYHDNQQSFSPGYRAMLPYVDGANDTTPGWGWGAYLLPYIEQNPVYDRIDFNLPIEDDKNSLAIQTMIKVYLCPSDIVPEAAFPVPDAFGNSIVVAAPSSYAACVGGDESDTTGADGFGVFYRNSRTRISDITDGTSTTLLIGERAFANANGIWAGAISGGVCKRGQYNPCPGSSSAWYPAATLVLAHSHFNNTNTDADGGLDDVVNDPPAGGYTPECLIFQALGTRANGELIPGDFFN